MEKIKSLIFYIYLRLIENIQIFKFSIFLKNLIELKLGSISFTEINKSLITNLLITHRKYSYLSYRVC